MIIILMREARTLQPTHLCKTEAISENDNLGKT